jgi:hypothetical protein
VVSAADPLRLLISVNIQRKVYVIENIFLYRIISLDVDTES